MGTKTVKICGYEVTGIEEVVTDIEKSFNRKDMDQDFSWENLYENDIIFCWNGKTAYHVTIDHKNKKILAYDE